MDWCGPGCRKPGSARSKRRLANNRDPRPRRNLRKLSVELGQDFRIADVGPMAGNLECLNFFPGQSEIAKGVRQFIFAARRWPELRDVSEDARPKGVDAGVVPRARRLSWLRFFAEIGQLGLFVHENSTALADIVASLYGQDRFRIA